MKKEEFLPLVEAELKKYELSNYYALLNQAINNLGEDINISSEDYVLELFKENKIVPSKKVESEKFNATMAIFAIITLIIFVLVITYYIDLFDQRIAYIGAVLLFLITFTTYINLIKRDLIIYVATLITSFLTIFLAIAAVDTPAILFFLSLLFASFNLFGSILTRKG